jgi:hypothetical protein
MTELGLQDAVQRAQEILEEELYPNQELKHLLLEEIERGPTNTWNVTLGFTRPGTIGANIAQALAQPTSNRVYKRIRIDAKTGDFKGMTDRMLQELLP